MSGVGRNERIESLKVVTWRVPLVDAAALEALTLSPEVEEKLARSLVDGRIVEESVVLQTCQRVLVATASQAQLDDVRARVVDSLGARTAVEPESFEGFAAFAHLAEVASSLDSLVPGEAQVLGQMKEAFANAKTWGTAGRGLTHVGSLVFRTAKRVRSNTELFRGKVSLIPLTLDLVHETLADRRDARVAVVGTGTIAQKMAEKLAEAGARVTFVSRDAKRAEESARTLAGATGTTWSRFVLEPAAFDVLAFATRTTAPLLGRAEMARFRDAARSRGRLLVLDLSLPRCVAPDAATLDGVELVALDELTVLSEEAKASRANEMTRAREIIAKELASVEALYASRPNVDEVVALRESFLAAAEERWARGTETLDLADPEVRLWYDQTVKHLLHVAQREIKRKEG